ncbi:MAG TPA: transglutaminase domain-containing protein [Bacteroidales bacterium]|nr:transglutaminase domain-containing protein [Bacteroidales bacterium]
MKKVVIIFFIFLGGMTFAQEGFMSYKVERAINAMKGKDKKSPETIADYIRKEVNSDDISMAYAAYYFVAHHLEYNFAKTRRITLNASRDEIIEDALRDGVGVCQHYAELFNAIARNLDMASVVIPGYTKQDGKVVDVPHSWNGLRLNDEWYLFDPTWGAGYLRGDEYQSRFSVEYFMVTPEKMIISHMPFDPLLQFLKNPVSHYTFSYDMKRNQQIEPINYKQKMANYFSQPEAERIESAMKRIRQHGIINEMTEKYYNFLDQNFKVHYANKQVDLHNEAVQILNNVVADYNAYADKKNKNRGKYPASKRETRALLSDLEFRVGEAGKMFSKVQPTMKMRQSYSKNLRIIEDLKQVIEKEKRRL